MKKATRITRFEQLGFGLFLHWGLYSLLDQGEWTHHFHDLPAEEYKKLQQKFSANEWDAAALAKWAKSQGMRYITLTTRHHEGFSLYDTCGLDDYDAIHSPAGRDLIKEFVEACRAEGLVPILYHTTLDWRWDTKNCSDERFAEYIDYLCDSVKLLCTNYGEIGGLWFDGNWSRPHGDWQLDRFYGMIRELQPNAMIINNTGLIDRGALGHQELDTVTFEQGIPHYTDYEQLGKYVGAEMCETMNAHWGQSRRDLNYQSVATCIENLALSRKVGANYLMNMGPSAGGGLPTLETAMAEKVGDWMKAFSEAVYAISPCPNISCQGRDFLVQSRDYENIYYYYAFDLAIRGDEHVTVDSAEDQKWRSINGLDKALQSAQWLDNQEKLEIANDKILCSNYDYGTHWVVRVAKLKYA